uniref:EamA domain-containing protein n=1 Tax=Chromera velia CCMP2878 TaxID=1169474 RepID=A0A0G4H494_9ALVE|eukprot:Cvel_5667.t1-p1 / transcript=Cvel_5667.t1 / gene=Cvel_5667 / organism=Chromera_velia_CCMP2878 / gene_product=hypothetical protein / transcript_product=hypothetical protein / location=Cvel_scaffold267:78431-79807(+) / protein_length=459 / sequence_SO=supercontig / SO=protein_coding / is_pseudo=false
MLPSSLSGFLFCFACVTGAGTSPSPVFFTEFPRPFRSLHRDGKRDGRGKREGLRPFTLQRASGGEENRGPEADKRETVSLFTPLLDSETKELTSLGSALLLSSVSLLWGTYTPIIKLLYNLPHPPPPMAVNFSAYLASIFLLLAARNLGSNGGADIETLQETSSDFHSSAKGREDEVEDSDESSVSLLPAGAELGLWLYLGSISQLFGLQNTPASRAAFEVQTTTVLVPLLASVTGGERVRGSLWVSVALAFAGVVTLAGGSVSLFPSEGQSLSLQNLFKGDLLVILSALFYSSHVVRLGRVAPFLPALPLATTKIGVQLVIAGLVVAWTAYSEGESGGSLPLTLFLQDFVNSFGDSVGGNSFLNSVFFVFLIVSVYNGGVSGYAAWAQSAGQKKVSPTAANLLYSLQPVWASLFAALLLKEQIETRTLTGGACIIAACLLAQTGQTEKETEKKKERKR